MEREWKDEVHLIEELGERPRIKLCDAFTEYLDQKLGTKGHQYAKTNVNTVNERFNVDMYVDEIRNWHLSNFKSSREKEGAAAQTIKHKKPQDSTSTQKSQDSTFDLIKSINEIKI